MAIRRILCTSGMKAHVHSGPQIMRCALLTNLSILLAIEVGRTGKRGDAYSTTEMIEALNTSNSVFLGAKDFKIRKVWSRRFADRNARLKCFLHFKSFHCLLA